MTMDLDVNIPYIIWIVVCVLATASVGAFCVVQLRRYLQRTRNTDAGAAAEVPVYSAAVLVNSVGDTNTAAQHAAAMEAVGHAYSVSVVPSNDQEQHAWYASQYIHTTHSNEVEGRGTSSVLPSTWPPSRTLASRDGEAADNHNPLQSSHHSNNSNRDAGLHESRSRGNGSFRTRPPPRLNGNVLEALHTSVSQQSHTTSPVRFPTSLPVAANPTPLGVLDINPLSPTGLRFYRAGSPTNSTPNTTTTTATAAASNRGVPSRAPPSYFTPLWMRGRQRRHVRTASSNVDMEVVEGYCCDEHGNRLTVRQAEDIYGGAAYIPQVNSVVAVVAEEEEGGEAERADSNASVFSFHQLTPSTSDTVK